MGQVGLNRRERRRQDTRERIFRSALKLFAEQGYLQTRIEDITEAADVGKGTFFNYFPGKEQVLGALAELQLSKLSRAREEFIAGKTSTRKALERLLHELAEEPSRSPALMGNLMAAMATEPSLRRRMRRNLFRGRRMLAAILSEGQRRGDVRRNVRPRRMARAFQQSAFGAFFLWSMHPETLLVSWLDPAFQLFWEGLRKGAKGARRSV